MMPRSRFSFGRAGSLFRVRAPAVLVLIGVGWALAACRSRAPEVAFPEGEGSLILYGEGWYDLEHGEDGSSWRWVSERGELSFFHNGSEDLEICLAGRVDRKALGGRPEVTVTLEGRELLRFRAEEGSFRRRIHVPREGVPPTAFSRLVITSDRSFRPVDRGAGADARSLSLMIEDLRIFGAGARGPRVRVIGWDGADWRMIAPLVRMGRMPNVERLIAHGRRGNLRSIRPTRSPALWTTMATGKPRAEHGITDFLLDSVPATSNVRRVKAIWNIVSEQPGMTVGSIGWYLTWPVEEVAGYMISDRFVESGLSRTTWPEGLTRPYGELHHERPGREVLSSVTSFT